MDIIAATRIPDERLSDGKILDEIFQAATGWKPKLWGKVIGYGQYHYRYDSGRQGDFCATGFAIGAREISLHILPGYTEFPDIAARLGPHRRGKSCWYLRNLEKVDEAALGDLIKAGLTDLSTHWPITPT